MVASSWRILIPLCLDHDENSEYLMKIVIDAFLFGSYIKHGKGNKIIKELFEQHYNIENENWIRQRHRDVIFFLQGEDVSHFSVCVTSEHINIH